MFKFKTQKEQRLWLSALAVVFAIFSTLGFAGSFTGLMRDSGLSSGLFLIGFLIILITITTQGLTAQPSLREVSIALGLVAVYLLLFVRVSISIERTHLIEYAVLATFIYEALIEGKRSGRRIPFPAITGILASSVIGIADEAIQALLPNRIFDFRDIFFNILAATLAVCLSLALGWIRRLRKE